MTNKRINSLFSRNNGNQSTIGNLQSAPQSPFQYLCSENWLQNESKMNTFSKYFSIGNRFLIVDNSRPKGCDPRWEPAEAQRKLELGKAINSQSPFPVPNFLQKSTPHHRKVPIWDQMFKPILNMFNILECEAKSLRITILTNMSTQSSSRV